MWVQRRQVASGLVPAGGPAVTTMAAEGPLPAKQHFPVAIVAGHGLLAATTLVLVLLAALGVGGS